MILYNFFRGKFLLKTITLIFVKLTAHVVMKISIHIIENVYFTYLQF